MVKEAESLLKKITIVFLFVLSIACYLFFKQNEIVIKVATLCTTPCIYVYAEGGIAGPATSVCNMSSFYKPHAETQFWIHPSWYAGYLYRVVSLKVKA